MTVATLSEGPAILVGYAWRLQIEAEAPVFVEGASYAGHLRLKPSDPTLLAELTSADGGIQHVTATVLELSLTPSQTASLTPGRVVLDLVRTDLEPDLHLGFFLEIPVMLPVTRGLSP
ncbi:hypothetical protein E7681_17130 [Thalassobius vesicularis]|jgi:hypothetical protein|uniref:Uncharacterized protein n=1 Tax=Thalassobius vesicularis TaxID=1294297 RepID=A0A4S3M5D7_9RHOB|nr:hypothetical protein [Thalassobius vesicularis]THD71832.1 hypothetical protein E7681_17130 [Thalassobius vesicularis]